MDPSHQSFSNTPQAVPPASSVSSGQPTAPLPVVDPGRMFAILGIVLAFFSSGGGILLSIIAKKKSRAAGFPTRLATIGILINLGVIILNIILFVILITLFPNG